MTITTETKTYRSPMSFSYDGGKTWQCLETVVISTSDWRNTPFGPMDFGRVTMLPPRVSARIEEPRQ